MALEASGCPIAVRVCDMVVCKTNVCVFLLKKKEDGGKRASRLAVRFRSKFEKRKQERREGMIVVGRRYRQVWGAAGSNAAHSSSVSRPRLGGTL